MDQTFLTRPKKQRSNFETEYNERFGTLGERRAGMTNISPQLAEKQHEMEHTNEALEETRVKYDTWKANFQRKRKEIDEKQSNLDEQKRNLEQFTRHHNMELEKARNRAEQETIQAEQIEKDLEVLLAEKDKLHEQNDQLRNELQTLQPCADYLQGVVEKSKTFDSIESILYRYQSLAMTRNEYLEKYQDLMHHYGSDEANLTNQLELRRLRLIDMTMKYNEGVSHVHQQKKQNEYRRTTLIKDVQRINDKTVELASIKTAIRNIYHRARQQSTSSNDKFQKKSEKVSIPDMLTYIENRFTDLQNIIHDDHVVYAQSPAVTPEQGKRKDRNSGLQHK